MITVDTRPHPGGSLNTTPEPHREVQHVLIKPSLDLDDDTPLAPSMGFTQLVPNPPMLSLDDETPLACPLRQPGDEGTCEACQ